MIQRTSTPDRPAAQGRPSNQFPRSPFEAAATVSGRNSPLSLCRLVNAEDLSVVFQPIIHMETFRVFAYEALTRCRVPAFANTPQLFERAVEEKCVGQLGRAMREVAVPLCAGRPLFLNLHPEELRDRWVVRPDDPMFFHDSDIYLEITESAPLTHFDLCRSVLDELRSRGHVHLVVDDLGAGYSNLKRIADLAPRIVKLDRDLVANLTPGSRHQRLVAGVVRLCEDLGAEVVAEGIETVTEWEALRETGVHYAQGFLFASAGFPLPPVTVPAEVDLVRNKRSHSSQAPERVARTPTTPSAPASPPTVRDTRTPTAFRSPFATPVERNTRTPTHLAAPAERNQRTTGPIQEPVPQRDARTPTALRTPFVAPSERNTRTPTSFLLEPPRKK